MISLPNHDTSEGDQWGRYNLLRLINQPMGIWDIYEAFGQIQAAHAPVANLPPPLDTCLPELGHRGMPNDYMWC
jgi:hypothetical protein